MDIFLIRHGQSEGNARRIFLGHTDWALTPLGQAQAEMTALFLRSKPIGAVFASDLIRAVQTANAFAKKARLPVQKDARLREIYAGLWEGIPHEEIARRYPIDHAVWKQDFDNARPAKGESVMEMRDRVFACVTELAQMHPGKTLALFTHATAIRAFYARLSGTPAQSFSFPPNASVTCVRYENGSFSPILYGQNDFLGDLATALPKTI